MGETGLTGRLDCNGGDWTVPGELDNLGYAAVSALCGTAQSFLFVYLYPKTYYRAACF